MATVTKQRLPRRRKKIAKSSDPRVTVARPAMGGIAIRALRQKYGVSQAVLARLLDVSLRTVSGAEAHATALPSLQRGLVQVRRLAEALGEAMNSDFIGTWLSQPNEMLNGLKPVEAIERGQLELVWQVVEGLRSGEPL